MSFEAVIGVVLALAAVLAMARLAWRHRRDPQGRWRLTGLMLAQPVLAVLLYFALLPPSVPTRAGRMVVLAAQAARASGIEAEAGETRIALPEGGNVSGAAPFPDLASALRAHPGTAELVVVGDGLVARDRDAAQGLALRWLPSPAPTGVIELQSPPPLAVGESFDVHGRAAGVAGGQVLLRDPAGRIVDRQSLDGAGRFILHGTVGVAGRSPFQLQLRDAGDRVRETLPLPLQVHEAAPPRLLVLAGAPSPELKYLRRWARDAGLAMHTQMAVGGGGQLGDAPLAITPATLSRFDLLLLDERSWDALGAGGRRAVADAARAGLGVLVRITAPLTASQRASLRTLDLDFSGNQRSQSVALVQPASAAGDSDPAGEHAVPLPMLDWLDLHPTGSDAVPLLHDADQKPRAWWRNLGLGRVGWWSLQDSFSWVLSGHGERHAALWSQVLATLARGTQAPQPLPQAWTWPGDRLALCGLQADARIRPPQGREQALVIDSTTGPRGCAAYWPDAPGWHQLRQGEAVQAFAVWPAGVGAGLQATRQRQAMATLVLQAPTAAKAGAGLPHPGPAWPWWLAWLVAATLAWAWERRRPVAG